MTRCCCCDHDPVAPSLLSESLLVGGRRTNVHYRRKLKDFYCEPCYNSVIHTSRLKDLRDDYGTDILALLERGLDSISKDTPTLPMRELV